MIFWLHLTAVMQAMLLKMYTGDLDLKTNAGFKFWKEHFHNIVAF